jgi:hypothetical protein
MDYSKRLIELHKELCDLGIGHDFRVTEPDIFPGLLLNYQPQVKRMEQCIKCLDKTLQ